MSEDRLERALQEMKDEDVDSGTLEGARARVWEKMTNADIVHVCGVPAGFPRLPGQSAGRQPPHAGGRPSQPLPRLSRPDRRNEGREDDHRHATAVLLAVGAVGSHGRGGRGALRSPLSRTRRHRRHDGSRRRAGHGRVRRGRPVPPGKRALSRRAPPSASGSRSAPARAPMRCCGSPTDRSWMSTSGRSCS